jgi:hypothetical protein
MAKPSILTPRDGRQPAKKAVAVMPNVSYMRPEVVKALPRWDLIADCLEGEDAIKAKADKYLPVPHAEAGGTTQDARYASYIMRAVFYGVTARTLTGLVGQVFGRDSVITLPEGLLQLVEDVEGTGTGLEQQAKKALEYVLSFGRGGLLADYPKTSGTVTKAQIESGEMRPIIKLYDPRNIINWRTKKVGAKTLLCLVVLRETVDVEDDGFETKTAVAYRILKLTEANVYTVELYREETNNGKTVVVQHEPPITPTKADGSTFNVIPFTFFGPENNDADMDASPLYSMATLNIAHYRNSADYEDACFIAGQPTPVFSGLTEEWVKNVMNGKVFLGSRGGIMLPKDGSATMLQAQPNMMPKEAMDMKEGQMRALGAKLVEERSIRRTATEATQDEAAQTSILSSATKNVTAAYKNALVWAQMFAPNAAGEVIFTLNSDFDLSNMTPQERQQLIAEWQAEAITFGEMRSALRRNGVATEDDDLAMASIKEHPPASSLMAQAALEAKAAGGNPDDNGGDNNGGN